MIAIWTLDDPHELIQQLDGVERVITNMVGVNLRKTEIYFRRTNSYEFDAWKLIIKSDTVKAFDNCNGKVELKSDQFVKRDSRGQVKIL